MAGILHRHAAHAVALGFFYGHTHGAVARYLPHAVACVKYSGGLCFLDYRNFGDGILYPGLDSVKVDGLESVDAMRLDAAFVALKEHVGADYSVIPRDAIADKCIYNEVCDGSPVDNIVF
ncbi:MAG: hypothetical protein BWY46_02059 [Firmicutes bacterium ADurb.Bin300]|nr:MAG: hypothetical protein BWY46_02059 [Firmicutes bacterium ADurb.Bin300]